MPIVVSGIATVLNLGIFFGLFFGLNYNQIVINRDYLAAECHIDATSIVNFYCPDVECSGCNSAPEYSPSCDALTSEWSTISPSTCGQSSVNINTSTSDCAISQECDGGYYCCSECCIQTCTSCTNVCSNSPDDDDEDDTVTSASCQQQCSTYCCQYSCCSSVNNRDCYANADVCYNAILSITYEDVNKNSHSTSYTFEEGTDQQAAINLVDNQYRQNGTYSCYYDTTNTNNILWSINYTIAYWAVTGVFTTTLFICFIWLSIDLVMQCLQYSPDQTIANWIATIFYFWIGLVISFGLLLPLYTNNKIPLSGKKVLYPVFLSWLFTVTALYISYFIVSYRQQLLQCIKQNANACCNCVSSILHFFKNLFICLVRYFKWFLSKLCCCCIACINFVNNQSAEIQAGSKQENNNNNAGHVVIETEITPPYVVPPFIDLQQQQLPQLPQLPPPTYNQVVFYQPVQYVQSNEFIQSNQQQSSIQPMHYNPTQFNQPMQYTPTQFNEKEQVNTNDDLLMNQPEYYDPELNK